MDYVVRDQIFGDRLLIPLHLYALRVGGRGSGGKLIDIS